MSAYTTPEQLAKILDDHKLWLSGNGVEVANLSGAYLSGAYLSGLRGAKVLTTTDHGYVVIAVWHAPIWRIYAGCRDFTVAESRDHWGDHDYHTPSSGRRILACLDWLESEPNPDSEEVPQ